MAVARANPLVPRARGKQFLSCSQMVKRVIRHSHSFRQTTRDPERAPCQVNLARTITGDFLAELRGGVHLPIICHTEYSMALHTCTVFNSGTSYFPDLCEYVKGAG
jgi:hypothetical protein